MEKESRENPTSPSKDDVSAEPERRLSENTNPSISDLESSGRGTGTTPEMSSSSTPQTSSGIDVQSYAPPVSQGASASGVPRLQIDPGSQSETDVSFVEKKPKRKSPATPKGKSPEKKSTPPKRRSPIRTMGEGMKEGLRRMRQSLSPKKDDKEPINPENRETAGNSPDEQRDTKSSEMFPKKSIFRRKSRSPGKADNRRSVAKEEQIDLGDEPKHPDSKSVEKSSKRSIFRSKSRSPGDAEKRRSREEDEPIIPGGEQRKSDTKSPEESSKKSIFRRKSRSPQKADSREGESEPALLGDDLRQSSTEKSPKRSVLRSKSRSPGKGDKRRSREERESILLGDELGQSSSSDEDMKVGDGSPGKGTIPKRWPQRRLKSKSPKPGKDASPSAKSRGQQQQKKGKGTSESAENLVPEKSGKRLPLEGAEIGKWTGVRMTVDESETCSPVETDLDSLASCDERSVFAAEETEREISTARERISKRLALKEDTDESPKEGATGGPMEVEEPAAIASPARGSKRPMKVEEVKARERTEPEGSPKKQPKCDGQTKAKDSKKLDSEQNPEDKTK